jgi:hypothetical protein
MEVVHPSIRHSLLALYDEEEHFKIDGFKNAQWDRMMQRTQCTRFDVQFLVCGKAAFSCK